MRTKGKMSSWNDEKGYGFIDPIGGGKRAFIHIKAFDKRNRRPEVGQVVTYTLSVDKRGRPCAVQATLAGGRLAPKTKKSNGALSIASAAFFFLVVGAAVIASKIPPAILAIYLITSLVGHA